MSYEKISLLASKGTPFLFITDFKGEKVEVFELENLLSHDIEFSFDQIRDSASIKKKLHITPVTFESYKEKFDSVIEKIKDGYTYILNLTQPTKIEQHLNFKEIFENANAKFKLRYKERFVCFSPERFIKIEGNTISTFPMKGTIDANIEDAKEKILQDEKEMAEHIMIVDLLRNDLGIVATNVRVEEFRYIDQIRAGERELLQVSSKISATLPNDWKNHLGEIIKSLLPAGSISGTPKKMSVKIIEEIEEYERGYFSGVFGLFDGESLDSAVMIRYIEKTDEGYIYKSGGGITLDSDVFSEYDEMIAKVYLPY